MTQELESVVTIFKFSPKFSLKVLIFACIFIFQFGHNYGRRMMQGSVGHRLLDTGIQVSQRSVSRILQQIVPDAYNAQRNDLLQQVNLVPYRAPFFGYKGHMDQNEKLEMYDCTHVAFIDGSSRYICKFITIPQKNPILIYKHLSGKIPL